MIRIFRHNKGFTLIELLIVMVIIAVLATLGLVSYQNAIRNSKNSKAIADMKAFQAAMEQAYTKNGGRYTTAAGGTTCDTSSLEMSLTAPAGLAYSSEYCTDTTYCRCATLSSGATIGNSSSTTTSATCPALGASGAFYCVQQRQ